MNKKITIIFDLSEVIISGIMGVESKLSSRLQVSKDLIKSAMLNDELHKLFRGEISEEIYLETLITKYRWDIHVDEIKEIIRANFHNEVPGMIEMLPRFSKEANLILLSDHAREWIEYIKKIYSFWHFFDQAIFSYEIGQEKRDPSTFGIVLKKIGKDHSQCVFVDDSPLNIENAQRYKINSLLFTTVNRLNTELSWYIKNWND